MCTTLCRRRGRPPSNKLSSKGCNFKDILQEFTCARCGKTKVIPYGGKAETWAYRIFVKYKWRLYCSWHCLRTEQLEREAATSTAKHRKGINRQEVLALLEEGYTATEVAEHLNISRTRVYQISYGG